MAVVLFFAQAREAAGTKTWNCSATTVGEAIDDAAVHFGEALTRVIPHCKVWVNGEPAERSTPIFDRDEVALLPPVSGG
jgi:molybdopterin converting factor small subunit